VRREGPESAHGGHCPFGAYHLILEGSLLSDQRPILADRDETLEAAFDALAHVVVERLQVGTDLGRREWRARAS
jgi:hypothetical protein